MNSFGPKRQPRKITVQDDDEDDGGAPLQVRPSLGSRSSTKLKKKPSTKISFSAADTATNSSTTAELDELPTFKPKPKKNPLIAAATENNAFKKLGRNNTLPLRSVEDRETQGDDRPRYSKEYLSELQNSTPNTPADLSSLQGTEDDDVLALDPSELEGATVVETTNSTSLTNEPTAPTVILTESEIAEKKSRRERERARLASRTQSGAEDFISLDDDDDERGHGDSYLAVLSRNSGSNQLSYSKSKEKRLTTDDDLAEDDSFWVEDGGLSLGKKAEREAARKKRADMANMIAAAEGNSEGDTSDDSEAERRAAYEKAQTRAGMDGLAEEREVQRKRQAMRDRGGVSIPPKITPLPDLSVLVEEFKARMERKEIELRRARNKIEELKREKESIDRREPEVQELLNKAGERYRELMGAGATTTENGEVKDPGDGVSAAKSFLEHAKARGGDTPGGSGRGLETMGTTPVGQERMEI